MSPHAVLPDYSRTPSSHSSTSTADLEGPLADRTKVAKSPYLRRTSPEDIHDLVCVGLGPASLAIAVALHDAFEAASSRSALPKVAFLERQPEFAWHAGMQIPGAKMQISFMKDLATLRNPRSNFTFINYLHRNNRLTQFSNLGTFLPRRMEYEDYMRWSASHFSDVVSYSSEVTSITPSTSGAKPVSTFTITSRDLHTGSSTTLQSHNVLIAVGGRPRIPPSLPQHHPRVVHSSAYQRFLSTSPSLPLNPRIAIIGAGQSAAEIFNDVHTRFPTSTSYLIIKGSALRPSDDSPFVNEVFDPERVDDIYAAEPDRRREQIAADRATNYGVVRLELLERIYEEMYHLRITHGNDEERWPRRILNRRVVVGTEERGEGVSLRVEDSETGEGREALDVDLVFVASGYERDMHEGMLQGCRSLLPSGKGKFDVERDYSVRFAEGKVRDGSGIWLQGCNEGTHGLSDTLLSILAVRGGEIVSSIFGR